ncbi:MAG: ubiquinol-cytochrome c reductase iron-sulfur subunit [Hyphomicrobiaceae bacterium]
MDNIKDTVPAEVDDQPTRRDFLLVAAGAWVAVGAGAALWPLVASMNPAADVLALATTEVNLAPIALGQRVTVQWRGKPVFIDHRTPAEIARARADDHSAGLLDPQTDEARVKRPEWLIVIGVCTHLGCVPLGQRVGDPRGPYDGWTCPCHGSIYDGSGRVRRGPAPKNLVVPAYHFVGEEHVVIG